jgi:hypothetical protein
MQGFDSTEFAVVVVVDVDSIVALSEEELLHVLLVELVEELSQLLLLLLLLLVLAILLVIIVLLLVAELTLTLAFVQQSCEKPCVIVETAVGAAVVTVDDGDMMV